MEFSKLLENAFKRMFNPKIYWSNLVSYLLLWLAVGTLFMIGLFIVVSVTGIGPQLSSMIESNTFKPESLLSTVSAVVGLLSILGFCVMILYYLSTVIMIFTIKRIDKESQDLAFFDQLGASFLPALKYTVAVIIWYIYGIVILGIIYIFAKIPLIGIIIAVVLGILAMIYWATGGFNLLGKIATESNFSSAISSSVKLGFSNPMSMLYVFLLLVIICLVAMITSFIGLIPFVGLIAQLFIWPLLSIYVLSVAYDISKD